MLALPLGKTALTGWQVVVHDVDFFVGREATARNHTPSAPTTKPTIKLARYWIRDGVADVFSNGLKIAFSAKTEENTKPFKRRCYVTA